MDTENRALFAARLREERERLELSQAEIAERCGAKPRTYQDWERAVASVSIEFLSTAMTTVGLDAIYVLTGIRSSSKVNSGLERTPKFFERLREERKRLGLNQTDFSAFAGVCTETQSNYERGSRKPDSGYLEAIALRGVDVGYLLTGFRSTAANAPPQNNDGALFKDQEAATRGGGPAIAGEKSTRYLTAEQEALLDNYMAADEQGRAATRTVLEALAKTKRANG